MARPQKKERNAQIIKMRKRGYSLEEVALFFNISEGRVSQIVKEYATV